MLFGSDSKEDAFGNNNGGVEPSSFLFEDGGTVDNGDLVLGNFGETVDSIDWHTDQPLTLAGFAIALGGEGGPGNNRGAELVRFLVEGNQVALFDANATGGIVSHLFSGGNVTGDDFRIEFTRSSTSGTRVGEIDAILGIPEPTAALSLLLGAGVVALRRRRAEPRA